MFFKVSKELRERAKMKSGWSLSQRSETQSVRKVELWVSVVIGANPLLFYL